MAFDLNGAGGLGSSTTDYTAASGDNINAYAQVISINGKIIVVQLPTSGAFEVGDSIMVHASASRSSAYVNKLGNWRVVNITNISGSNITVDQSLDDFPNITGYFIQLVKIPSYHDFTVPKNIVIGPPAFDGQKGGIFAVRCSGTFTIAGRVDLTGKGLPTSMLNNRPLLPQEQAGTLDTDPYAGWENALTPYNFVLNVGDGAAFILADKLANSSGKIGNPNATGQRFCRGADDSYNKPDGFTIIGGSTILVAAHQFSGSSPSLWAKYRSGTSTDNLGKGLARCYFAYDGMANNDEGLMSNDAISDPALLKSYCKVKDFGNGSFGNVTKYTRAFNSYARVTSFSGKTVNYTGKTTSGLAKIEQGALVMIHFKLKATSDVSYNLYDGRFILANVLADDGVKLTLDQSVPDISLTDYLAQVVAIPQFENLDMNGATNSGTPKFDGKVGGICAVAVSDTCTLTNAKLNVYGKGGGEPSWHGNPPMRPSNVNCRHRLPLGQGSGSVFILAKNLTMDGSTRIGSTTSGAAVSGYKGTVTVTSDHTAAAAYSKSVYDGKTGGFGSNSSTGYSQGASVFLVVNTITGFNINALSTGGEGSSQDGGAGYGGGQTNFTGSYLAGGLNGGGSGFAYVYCNNVVGADYTDILK